MAMFFERIVMPRSPLEVVRVEDPLARDLGFPELAALPQHLVDKGRLAVIHVRDDRDVPDVRAVHVRFILLVPAPDALGEKPW